MDPTRLSDEDLARLEVEESKRAAAAKAAANTAATNKAAGDTGFVLPGSERRYTDADLAAMRPGVLGNSREDDPLGGAKNLAAGTIEGVAALRGTGQGLVDTGRHIGAAVQSIWDDRTTKQILEERAKERLHEEEGQIAAMRRKRAESKGTGWWADLDRAALDRLIADREKYKTGESARNIYKNMVPDAIGDYEPTTWAGRRVREAVPAAMSMMLSPQAGRTALGLGAATGAAAGQTNETFPNNPNLALIPSFGLPFIHGTGATAWDHYSGKTNPAKTMVDASRTLAETATEANKKALFERAQAADEAGGLIEGQQPTGQEGPGVGQRVLPQGNRTIAELTGDQGLTNLERAVRAEDKALPEEIGARNHNELQTDRAQGRVDAAKSTLAPDSSPLAVAQFIEERQRALDEGVNQLGTPMSASESGGFLKEKVRDLHTWFKQQTNRLYEAIDPHDQYQLLTPGLRGTVEAITGENRPGFGGAAAPGVQEMLNRTASWPKVVGFNDLRAYLKDLNEKLRETAPAGGQPAGPGFRHYEMLKKAATDDIKSAAANQVAHEAELVRQGKMAEGDTLAARLAALDTEGTGIGPGPTRAVPGEPNLTAQAARDLEMARAHRAEQGRIFDNPLIRSILNANDSDTGGLAAKAFPGKSAGTDKGGDITRMVLEASKNAPEAVAALQDHALSLLQSMGERLPTTDGSLTTRITPKAVQQFLDKYEGSLGALEAASPGFLARFQNVANVQGELARKFIDERGGAKNAEASRALVKDLITDPRNGPYKLKQLMDQAKAAGATDVVEGMKHLVVENMFNSALDEVAGKPASFNGRRFLDLMNTNRGVLEAAGFTPQHMRLWQALAKDFGGQQTHELVNVPGKLRTSPGTAGNLAAIERAFAEEKAPFKPHSLGNLTFPAALHSPYLVPFVVAADAGWSKLQNMAHTAKIAGIKNRNDLIRAGIIDPKLGIEMLRKGSEDYVSPTWPARVTNALAQSAYYGMPGVVATAREDAKQDKPRRADGGRVNKLDCVGRAARLCREADAIRKKHAGETKAILHVPDNAVATALAIAGRGV